MTDQLRLSTPNGKNSAEDQKIINTLEQKELEQREKELNKNIADLKKLNAQQEPEKQKSGSASGANKIGARKNANFKAISTAPSINKTPVGSSLPPLPYPTTQDLSNSVGIVPNVRYNGNPAYVLNQSTQPNCKGDDPGTGKGIKSGTVNGEVKPVKGSGTVRIGKKPAIREGDPCTMNGGNNPGIYTTTQKPSGSIVQGQTTRNTNPPVQAETPEEKSFIDQAVQMSKKAGQYYKDTVSDSLHQFAGDAMDKGGTIAAAGTGTAAVGGVMVATGIGAGPGAVLVAGGGATVAVGEGVGAVGGIAESTASALDAAAEFAVSGKLPNMVAMGTAYAERMVLNKLDKLAKMLPGKRSKGKAKNDQSKLHEEKKAEHGGSDGLKILGSGTGDDCGIKPYKEQKCPKGQQAHHIVPDYALRYGNRSNKEARIDGMPSLEDGPSICLSGGSTKKGGDHNRTHRGTDPKIRDAGQRTDNGPAGAAPIGEIIAISVEEIGKVKPQCKDEVKKKVDEAFKNVDKNKYGRTTQALPKGETQGTLARAETHNNDGGFKGKKGRK